MAVETFLQIDEIEGEAQAKGHEGAMVVLEVGARQVGLAAHGTDRTGIAGKSTVGVRTIVGT